MVAVRPAGVPGVYYTWKRGIVLLRAAFGNGEHGGSPLRATSAMTVPPVRARVGCGRTLGVRDDGSVECPQPELLCRSDGIDPVRDSVENGIPWVLRWGLCRCRLRHRRRYRVPARSSGAAWGAGGRPLLPSPRYPSLVGTSHRWVTTTGAEQAPRNQADDRETHSHWLSLEPVHMNVVRKYGLVPEGECTMSTESKPFQF